METSTLTSPSIWCPRCRLNPLRAGRDYSWSRVTRDDGARIEVCNDCGEREAERDFAGVHQVGWLDWPVPIEEILVEDRVRYVGTREAADAQIERERDEASE